MAALRPPTQTTTIADVLNQFLSDKKRSLESGDLIQSTYDDFDEICDLIASLNKQRSIESLAYEDFSHLRSELSKGAKGQQLAASSVRRHVTMARGVFKFANDELGYSLRYKKALRLPTAKALRKGKNVERLFTPEELRLARDSAKPQMKAMILLGINCGFGNDDCGTLPIDFLDLDNGWHAYPRPKTQMQRRCPLWPETVAALEKVIGDRKSGLVFVLVQPDNEY